ncbi:alpha/beta hydrolase [Georgenia sp. TF02-10]|uniref:alpha/beta fold hydrolase n=1 Tax=Georgenia sp. TF02-10 TaxID=2917725 RepID=UPI001FA7A696|nr:alpha/beta hydrolase [Georgenia sp. TF02-10]UNX53865.1 alpha/beta hydrolase [Georgenia sp. TF02-10]
MQARLATGVRLAYAAQGPPDGVPVVLLHAWAESGGSFDLLRPRLPPALRVLVPDLRGHGASDKPAHGYALPQVAADVVAFLDAVGLPAAWLVGASSGGYVAQAVAVDHPGRVLGLVLVGAPRSLRGRPPFADEVARLVDPVDLDQVRRVLGTLPVSPAVPEGFVAARLHDGTKMPARVWRASLDGLATAVPPTEAGTVRAPTLLLWGDADHLVPRAEVDRLRAAIPAAELQVCPGAGHLLLWERPADVAAAVGELVLARPS